MCKKQHPCRSPCKSCDLVPFQDAINIEPNNTYVWRPVQNDDDDDDDNDDDDDDDDNDDDDDHHHHHHNKLKQYS